MGFRGVEKKGLPVDQPFKLLSDLHIQLDDTLIGLALASILRIARPRYFSAVSRTASNLALGSIIFHPSSLRERRNCMIVQAGARCIAQRGQSSTASAGSIIGTVAPCIMMRDELDLLLVDVAAVHASQGPVLKAGTRRDNALNCRTGLASRTARTLGGERRRLRIGHGIDPGKVTIGDYLNKIRGLEVPPLPL